MHGAGMVAVMNEKVKTLDVRPLPPQERNAALITLWNSLATGESMTVTAGDDRLALFYQLQCEHGGTFLWQYQEQGLETWRIRITKGDFPDPGFKPVPKTGPSMTFPAVLDLRPIFARGETPCALIADAAAAVPPGRTLTLVAPFEPVPLYAKLGKDGFTHRTERTEDGAWKVEFLKTPHS